MSALAPPSDGVLPRLVASALEVYVVPDSLECPGPASYHEREGCYGATALVPWTVAIDHELTPCGRCCESFGVVGT